MANVKFNAKNGLTVGNSAVGILDSTGNATLTTAMTTGSMTVGSALVGTTRLFVSGSSTGNDSVFVVKSGVDTGQGAVFSVLDSASTNILNVTKTRRVGVGTDNPSARLQVVGSDPSAPVVVLQIPTGEVTANVFEVKTPAGATKFSIDSLGTFSATSGSYTGDVTIAGNLTVAGTQTIVNSETVNIKDNIILLNAGPSPLAMGGIYVADTATNVTGSMLWDASADRWMAGLKGQEIYLVTTGSTETLKNKTIPLSGLEPNTITGGNVYGSAYFNSSNVLTSTATGVAGQLLQSNGAVAPPAWVGVTTIINSSNIITGSGTTNYLSKFSSGNAVTNSTIQDNGTTVTFGSTAFSTTSPLSWTLATDSTALSLQSGLFRLDTTSTGVASFKLIGVDTRFTIKDGNTTGNILIGSSNAAFTAWKNLEVSSLNTLFFTAGSERMRIDNTGKVGIGTTSPGFALEVVGSMVTSGSTGGLRVEGSNSWSGRGAGLEVENSSGTSYITSYDRQTSTWLPLLVRGSTLNLQTGGTSALYVDSSQNVGIGTSASLTRKFNVQGTGYFSSDVTVNSLINTQKLGTLDLINGDTRIGTYPSRDIIFGQGSSGTEFGRFLSTGLLAVTGSVQPGTDNLYDLGSSTKRWANVYATSISGSLTGSNVSSGQIVVAGTGGVLSGSNDLYWVNSTRRVGIGTNAPVALLHVSGTAYVNDLYVNSNGQAALFSTRQPAGGLGDNIFIGGGGQNVGIGTSNFQGSYNTSVGVGALSLNTTGYYNTAFGSGSLPNNTTGYYNTAIGNAALFNNTTGTFNTAIGPTSLFNNTTGLYNTALGSNSLYANTTGDRNTGAGYASGINLTTGYRNTALGAFALFYTTTGIQNTAVGRTALHANVSGSHNVAVGHEAGRYIATGAIMTDTTGSVYIGHAVRGQGQAQENQVVIAGTDANATIYGVGLGSNTTVIGNSATTVTYLAGKVAVGGFSPTARLEVTGSTADSSAAAFHVLNSSNSSIIYARNDAKVGIGTSTLTEALNINGNTLVAGYGEVQFNNSAQRIYSSSGGLLIQAGGRLRFFTGGANERINIEDVQGLVGIGTSGQTARLTVSGSSTAATPTMIVREGVVVPTNGVGVLDVQNSAGSSLFFVSGSGNIGVGITTNSSYKLNVQGTSYFSNNMIVDAGLITYRVGTLATISSDFRVGVFPGYNIVFGAGNAGTEFGRFLPTGLFAVTGSIEPGISNSYDLGSSTKLWRNVFASNISGSLTGSNVSAGQVVIAGAGGVLSGSNDFWWNNTSRFVGIGTSSPARPLDVNGSLRLQNAGVVEWGGTSTYVAGESSTNTLFFNTNTTERMRIDSSGNVGVGTVSASARLHVSGSSTASTPTAIIREGISANASNVAVMNVQSYTGGNLLFVSGSGNVGIGTVPASRLHVVIPTSAGAATPGFLMEGTGTGAQNWQLYPSTSSTLILLRPGLRLAGFGSDGSFYAGGLGGDTGAGASFIVDGTTDNVAVGTSAASVTAARLFVTGSSTASTPTMVVREGAAVPAGGVGTFDVQNYLGTSLLFVSGSGDVGIGITTPTAGTKLHVVGNQFGVGMFGGSNSARLGLKVYNTNTAGQSTLTLGEDATTTYNFGITRNGSTHSTDPHLVNFQQYNNAPIAFWTSNIERVRIDASGNVGIGTTAMDSKLVVNGSSVVSGSVLPSADNTYSLGSATKRWSNLYATTASLTSVTSSLFITTPSSTGSTFSKTFASGETGRITATVDVATASSKSFTVAVSHGAMLFDLALVSSISGFSVAKKYTVSAQFGENPITFKLMDTGPYTGYDLTVSFSKSNSTTTQCTISHNYTSTVNVGLTIDVAATSTGNSGTTVTLF